MIIVGWTLKSIARFDLHSFDKPEIILKCSKHNINYELVVGKLYYEFFFIPLNYFFAKENLYRICPKCSETYEELEDDINKMFLDFYHKKITHNELNKKIKGFLKKRKEKLKNKKSEAQEFGDFLKYLKYVFIFFIILLILKYGFNLF